MYNLILFIVFSYKSSDFTDICLFSTSAVGKKKERKKKKTVLEYILNTNLCLCP